MTIQRLLLLLVCCAFTTAGAQDWQREAIRKYPDLSVEGSAMNRLFVQRHSSLRATDADYFTVSEWPLHLADECARELGVKPRQTPQTPTPLASHPSSLVRALATPPTRAVTSPAPQRVQPAAATAEVPGTPQPATKSFLDLRDASTGKLVFVGLLAIATVALAYSYLLGWWRDFVYSIGGLVVAALAGAAAVFGIAILNKQPSTTAPIDGSLIGFSTFLLCHLYIHLTHRCGKCGAHRWRVDRVSSIAVGERTVMRRRERVKEHYNSRGVRVGTTKEHEDVPDTQTIYETTWECQRCGNTWETTN